MSFRYTEEHIEFLRKGFKKKRIPELTAAFNAEFDLDRKEGSIRAALKNRKITCGRKGFVKGERSVLFSPEQVAFIKEQYKVYSRSELTIEFNERFKTEIKGRQITSFVKNQGIKCGRNGHFGKGHVTWNKGTKGLVKPNSGNFKKGDVPPNSQPVGSERVNSMGVIDVKIAEPNPYVAGQMTRWKQKHIILWEEKYGPVPDGHVIIFRDSDKMNCQPENLMLITRKVNAYLNRNGYGTLPGELKLSAIALAKVAQKASSLVRQEAA